VISSDEEFTLDTDNLIDSSGDDSGGTGTTGLHAVYLSNSSASYAASSLRASTTTPTWDTDNGHYSLGTSGNSKNWRFVGWLYFTGAGACDNEMCVSSEHNEVNKVDILTDGTGDAASVNSTWEDAATALQKNILVSPGYTLQVTFAARAECTTANTDVKIGVYFNSSDNEMISHENPGGGYENSITGVYTFTNTTSSGVFSLTKARHQYADVTGSNTKGKLNILLLKK
jgi:hypothetical protein